MNNSRKPMSRSMLFAGAMEIIAGLLAIFDAWHRHATVPAVVAPLLLISGAIVIWVATKRR